MSALLLLKGYVFVDTLDFVVWFFQSGVFEYILVYNGQGGAVAHICKTYLCTPRKLLWRAKTNLRGTFGTFNVPPRGFCQVWLNPFFSLKINIQ